MVAKFGLEFANQFIPSIMDGLACEAVILLGTTDSQDRAIQRLDLWVGEL